LPPQDVYYLASAADLLLAMRDLYGKKWSKWLYPTDLSG
jgi:hypothetical protein